MKNRILRIVSYFIVSIALSVNCNAFDTLSKLTEACFKAYPEYAERNESHSQRITLPKDLLYKKIAEQYESDTTFDDKTKWMKKKKVPDNFFKVDSPNNFSQNAFVQKVTVQPGSTICLMGDYHGSQHSLLRNLWRLVKLGHLNNNFEIVDKDKFYMVFLGDYINFGSLSDEVVYTVLKLKEKNWNNVFLTNGNNEFSDSRTIFKYNPMAVFIGWKDNYIQCCHSSVSENEDFSQLLSNKNLMYALTTKPDRFCTPFLRQDQLQGRELTTETITKHLKKYNIKALFRGHQDSFFGLKMFAPPNFIEEPDIDKHINNLKALAKNYIDKDIMLQMKIKFLPAIHKIQTQSTKNENKTQWFQTKFLEDPNANGNYTKPQQLITIPDYGTATRHSESPFSNERGPYSWKVIVDTEDLTNGIQISKKHYTPIYTLTTATEGRNVPYDSFCLLKTAIKFEDWRLKPYETYLDESADRHNKYVRIEDSAKTSLKDTEKDVVKDNYITIKWSETNNATGVDQNLINLAKVSKGTTPLTQSLTSLETKLASLAKKLSVLKTGQELP